MPIISVDHVTKEFQLGQLVGAKQSLLNAMRRLTGKPVEERKPFKALNDITFSAEKGEVVGVIGHNGAGKSTLLKMLANISAPTHGQVRVEGKVAPLIEVGAGLIGDLTGRENIYLNGALLGMTKKEIDRKFEDIVDFSEVRDFIDTPIKRYSSGMQVKLAFAIATSVEADILIVDEVLAVGDLAFQRKCFDRMEDIIRGQKKTVLLVSHNIRQVERICSRVILMDHGRIVADGPTAEVCELFYKQSNERIHEQTLSLSASRISGSGEVEIDAIDILDEQGHVIEEIDSGASLRVKIAFTVHKPIKNIEIVAGTHRTDFIYISSASTRQVMPNLEFGIGQHEIEYIVETFPLVAGTYSVRLVFADDNWHFVFHGESLKTFTVRPRKMESLNNQWKTVNLPTRMLVNGTPLSIPQ